jgi:tellurite resistance protein
MQAHVEAIVKSLVAVAWADGRVRDEEHEVIDALIEAFALSPEDAAAVRAFATEPRTLDEIPLTELSADDRRLLLQHAVIVTYVDGEQSTEERALLEDLARRLHIPEEEAQRILEGADRRAKRLVELL